MKCSVCTFLKAFFCLLPCFFACEPDARFHPSQSPATLPAPTNRFELLSPEQTGVRFVPSIKEEFRYNFMADPYIYNGGGVAVIDVNNDGLQDLFFTARLQGCRLYLNKGNLKFDDISESSGVAKFSGLKTGVATVDVNADGWSDLYVCRTWLSPLPERSNLLFINNKDNTFSEQAAAFGLDDLSASQHANFFDYDRDGDLDCYVVNHPVDFKSINTLDVTNGNARAQAPRDAYESDRLYRNDGGKFSDVSAQAGIQNRAFGLSSLATDLNNDGWTDLFVGNDFVMPDFLYINNGKGGFTDEADAWFAHTSNHTMGADLADFNRDGYPELVTPDMLAAAWPRRQRLMSTMSLERDRSMRQQGYGRQVMRNVFQLNTGAGKFSEIGEMLGMAATDWSWAPLGADFDNDGERDLFISSGVKRDLNDLDFFLYTADSINRTGGVSKNRFPDFESYSGLMPSNPSHNYMFRQNGVLQFNDVSEQWGFGQAGFSTGAAYTDLDNDGDLDLVTCNLESPPGIYENKATTFNNFHWLQLKCKGTAQNPQGIGAKVRIWVGDSLMFAQEMTPVRGFYSSVEPMFQVGLGARSKVERLVVEWPGGRYQVLENLNANQRITLDIVQAQNGKYNAPGTAATPYWFEEITTSAGIDFVHRENPFEDFDREKLLPARLSRSGPCMAVADFNADGAADLFVGGAAGQAGMIYFQGKDGRFSAQPQSAFEADKAFEDSAVCLFDADSDGDQDIFVASGGYAPPAGSELYQDRLYLNDGKGSFSRARDMLPNETRPGVCAAGGDLDGDGQMEIVVACGAEPGRYPQSAGAYVLKKEGKAFVDRSATLLPGLNDAGLITDMLVTDLEGDGKPELLVAGEWMSLKVFRNGGKEAQHIGGSGWWHALAAADLDSDGDMDIVAGNWGLNSRYKASEQAPMRLFANDFDRNGSLDALLCMAWNGAYYPMVQRDALAAQIPQIRKQFPRHAAYAQAGITDIFDEKLLLGGMALEAQSFETQWFENNGGQFTPHTLPWLSQASPVYNIIVADVNADTHPDLILTGNAYDNTPETYQIDAGYGTVLIGDGKGNFRYVPNRLHGLWAGGQIRDVVQTRDTDGKNILILGENNNRIRVFSVKLQ